PRSIAVDNEDHVWIGTRDHGLFCLSFDNLHLVSIEHLTTENGLPENFINNLQCDDDNMVWACTPAGLDRIRLEKGRFMIDNFTYSQDNYQSVYHIQSSRHGVHWALVKGGFMKILSSPREDSASQTGRYLPQVLFSQVIVDNRQVTDTTRKILSLSYDRNNISFFVGVTSFINETQTRYSYFLEGSSHPGWSPLSRQSAINFANLPPGKYTLQVKARFLSGSYPDQQAGYAFVIRPPWWLTGWFWVAVMIGLIGLTLAAIRLYTRRRLEIQRVALERKQAIERERTRIATDMHDDLGAGLSRIRFLSETIGIKRQQQLPIEEEITGIREYSHEMIDKMGEIVWALNEKNDSLSDLLSYTRSYAAEYLLQAGIRCAIEMPDDPPFRFVSGEFRRNVYLIIKEALHNIVKHAQAENVFIHIAVDGDLVIIIRDDGVGFDPGYVRPFRNGLYNMQKRVRDIGGVLIIESGRNGMAGKSAGEGNPGGTSLRLSAPL
ncbi:MAG TPA: triple tyrosine motif-containing protein, partial [Puia sp.]|nr:triple tyrosine motif-containing protein [Puia sp.]